MTAPITPEQAMRMAIEEGKKGAGFVSPNPLVGCVILDRSGAILSTGYHARVGEDHAEAAALRKLVGQDLSQAHVFVTLEPCAHEGRTPSCAKALAALKVGAVTYGLEDPNPLVSGQGAELLRAAGVKVEKFQGLQTELEELAEIFLTNMRLKRPFVAAKVGASLDGRIALDDGSSQWITSAESREYANDLRGHYDAVVTGIGTLQRDNPRLNSRSTRFQAKAQKLVVLDPSGRCLPQLTQFNISKVRSRHDIVVVTNRGAGGDIELPLEVGEFDLTEVARSLRAAGLNSLFVEAGGITLGRFIKTGLMDRLYLFVAPTVLGQGISWTSGLKIPALNQAFAMANLRAKSVGPDLLLTARRLY